jgi:hypothetical protein
MNNDLVLRKILRNLRGEISRNLIYEKTCSRSCWSRRNPIVVPGMKPNRSIPAAAIVPVLIYPDVREAVGWLCGTFGLSRGCGSDRAQLWFGDGAIIVADVRRDQRWPGLSEQRFAILLIESNLDRRAALATMGKDIMLPGQLRTPPFLFRL